MSYYNASGSLRWPTPGPSDVASYQLSAIPWMTSSTAPNGSAMKISFPATTRWVEVMNTGGQGLRIGFSNNGTIGNPPPEAHYFTLPTTVGAQTSRWELRCSEIYLYGVGGAVAFSLAAGLSPVPSRYFDAMSGSLGGVYGGVG
jgi:hypothetical protein